jgi:hypothetical protein
VAISLNYRPERKKNSSRNTEKKHPAEEKKIIFLLVEVNNK